MARGQSHGREQPEREAADCRDQLFPEASVGESDAVDDVRLFPIVCGALSYPVVSLLARGRLEQAGRLVPDRSWVASTPLYG
jgi:hypothetical protein